LIIFPIALGIVAIIFGMASADKDGLGVAGIILGIIGVLFGIMMLAN
jgi:uncharacterized membrane protein HdeD (DUF308 family)